MILDLILPCDAERAKKDNLPLVIPAGGLAYHGPCQSLGCDSLVVEGLLYELAQEKEMMIAPTIHYGPFFSLGADKSRSASMDKRAFEGYVYCIFKAFLFEGYRNIYVVTRQHLPQENEPSFASFCRAAAKRATTEYLEKTLGQGWWGSESYADYYERLEGENNPFNWIKVLPLSLTAPQDRLELLERSVLSALYTSGASSFRYAGEEHWLAEIFRDADIEWGKEAVKQALSYLDKAIQ
ncbi:MAG: creatininase family protein [Clostridia bacterium]|nr:creatininase family protein [Clostridia bacterium]